MQELLQIQIPTSYILIFISTYALATIVTYKLMKWTKETIIKNPQ